MMISQPALICLNATWQRLMRRSAHETEPASAQLGRAAAPPVAARNELVAVTEPAPGAELIRESIAPEVHRPVATGAAEADGSAPLAANERRARAAALRAMALSRERRFDAARTAFAEAAGLDPVLDLTRTPAFWKLERAAHEAAIDAYRQAGRDRDAAVLRARVQSTFRPKLLRSRPQVMLTP